MHHVHHFCKTLLLSLGLLLPMLASAQTEMPLLDRLDQWMREMDGQMRRAMPLDSLFSGGRLQISPDSNSFFYFRVDTSFDGTSKGLFDLSPFGHFDRDDFFGGGFPDLESLFDRFFDTSPAERRPRQHPDFPADDGSLPPTDDLLPEERLREQEERTPAPKKEPKTKTIRI